MTHQVIARDMLAVLCALQGGATVAIDLNCNHARSAEWTGHARFHVVWQTTAFAALAVVEIVLLFLSGPSARQHFYLAALLAAVPMLGFFVAFLGRGMYGGLLADANGIPPARVQMLGFNGLVDLNLVAEIAGFLTLILIVALFRHR